MMEPLISIIVPIYNGEEYIKKCVESLRVQSFSNIEIILINDGSTDNTLSIINHYKLLDARISVINQPNCGVSVARKNGVKRACADYIMFVDADDWIDVDTCKICINKLKQTNADAILFSYVREYENKSLSEYLFESDISFEGEDVIKKLVKRLIGLTNEELRRPEKFDSLSSMYMKVYKKEYISDEVKFLDLKKYGHHEDTIFNLQVLIKMDKVYYINKPLYHYRKFSKGSISKQFELEFIDKWQLHLDFIENYISEDTNLLFLNKAFNNRVSLELIGIIMKELSINNPRTFKEKVKAIKKLLNTKRYKEALKNLKLKHMPIQWKLFFGGCKYNFISLVLLLGICMNFLKSRV